MIPFLKQQSIEQYICRQVLPCPFPISQWGQGQGPSSPGIGQAMDIAEEEVLLAAMMIPEMSL